MDSKIGFIYAGNTLTVTVAGVPFVLGPEHRNIGKVREILSMLDTQDIEEDDAEKQLLELMRNPMKDFKRVAKELSFDDITVEHGVVVVNGEELHNSLTEKILEFQQEGLPFNGLVRFMVNLSHNQSKASQEQLFDFLSKGGFPITPDGHFLGYKGVRQSFYDQHSNTFLNSPGKTIEMKREAVCADPSRGCAPGLHVGTLSYASGFSTITVLVKVNPRDAVSVPNHDNNKLRVCRYHVLRVYEGDKVLARPHYDEEEIMDDQLESRDEEYRKLHEEGLVIKAATYEELFEKYNAMNRDVVCREAAAAGFFLSTNEARDMGKLFVVQTLANRGLPLQEGRRDQLAKLAARRGLFNSERSALRKGRTVITERLQEDVENRQMADQADAQEAPIAP
jgi:hypothetical protein